MSRRRGHDLQRATAEFLRHWWPAAESNPNGRSGKDILNIPGVSIEVKTAVAFRPVEFSRQAMRIADDRDVPIVVYWPKGIGAARPHRALAIMPLPWAVKLLVDARVSPVGWTEGIHEWTQPTRKTERKENG